MSDFGPETYGDRIAAVYDGLYDGIHDLGPIVDRLVALAEGGPVLELGIGTGRLALPLAAAGTEVSGIDASPAMIERLRAKPGGAAIPVRIGDFGSASLGDDLALVFVAFNTFFALPDQASQVACMANVASALRPGGRFVVEAFVPDLGRFDRGQCTQTLHAGVDRVDLVASTHDTVRQRVESVRVVIADGGIETYPVQIRYAWPAELDLMARLAGLELEHRWDSWDGSPYTATAAHVSVWRRPT